MKNRSKNKELKCLALDGGGIRGVLELVYLRILEYKSGMKICELFDVIVGTSTGGLIALLLTVPSSISAYKKLMGISKESSHKMLKGSSNKDLGELLNKEEPPNEKENFRVLSVKEIIELYIKYGSKIFDARTLNFYRFIFFSFIITLVLGFMFPLSDAEYEKSFGSIAFWSFIIIIFLFAAICGFHIFHMSETNVLCRNFIYLLLTVSKIFAIIAHIVAICELSYSKTLALCLNWYIFVIPCPIYFVFIFGFWFSIPKYSSEGLNEICEALFEKRTLKDAKTTIGVVSTDLDNRASFVFNSMRANIDKECKLHNAPIKKIARATSSAPTYFPPEEFEIGSRSVSEELTPWSSLDEESEYDRERIIFQDGGTTANNPSLLCLELANKKIRAEGKKPSKYNIRLLSLGTGTVSGKQEPLWKQKNQIKSCNCWSLLFLCIKGIYDNITNDKLGSKDGGRDDALFNQLLKDPCNVTTNSHNVHMEVKGIFEEQERTQDYLRIQFKISADQLKGMDDYSEKNINKLIKSAEETCKEYNFENDIIIPTRKNVKLEMRGMNQPNQESDHFFSNQRPIYDSRKNIELALRGMDQPNQESDHFFSNQRPVYENPRTNFPYPNITSPIPSQKNHFPSSRGMY